MASLMIRFYGRPDQPDEYIAYDRRQWFGSVHRHNGAVFGLVRTFPEGSDRRPTLAEYKWIRDL